MAESLKRIYRKVLDSETFRAIRRRWLFLVTLAASHKGLTAPVFILGAPRSGTTLLGSLIGKHPSVFYMNEPKWLWASFCRKWDSYGAIGDPRHAAIQLTEEDIGGWAKYRLRSIFAHLLRKHQRRLLVEKTPDNSARVRWLLAIFPDARFIHIVRNPHDMAASLALELEKWFPQGWECSAQYKVWERHAQKSKKLSEQWNSCQDNYQRGLLIWSELNSLASTEAGSLANDRYISTNYEDLICNPTGEVGRLFKYLGLDVDCAYLQEICSAVRSPSLKKEGCDQTLLEKLIDGEVLAKYDYLKSQYSDLLLQ